MILPRNLPCLYTVTYMDFRDTQPNPPNPWVELVLKRILSPGLFEVELNVYGEDMKKRSTQLSEATEAELQGLADWIEHVWSDDTPPYTFSTLPLRLEFSHREHIGEIYYSVYVNNTFVNLVYEQGGGSNVLRAQELRHEISTLSTP